MAAGAVLAAFVAETAIVTWRDVTNKTPDHTVAGLPLPADYLAAVGLYGALGLISKANGADTFAALVGWAFVVATLVNVWNPGNPISVGSKTKAGGTTAPATNTTGGTLG